MNSAFLNKIGLGNVDIGHLFLILFILLIILILGVGYIIYENIRFRIAYKKFMKGSTADSLEEKIFQMCEEQDSLESLASSIQGKSKSFMQNISQHSRK